MMMMIIIIIIIIIMGSKELRVWSSGEFSHHVAEDTTFADGWMKSSINKFTLI
jgi:hypothetical protein